MREGRLWWRGEERRRRGRKFRRAIEQQVRWIGDGGVDEQVDYSLDGRCHLHCIPLFVFYQLRGLCKMRLMERLQERLRLRRSDQTSLTFH